MKFILSLLAFVAFQLLPASQATAGEWWEPAMKSAMLDLLGY